MDHPVATKAILWSSMTAVMCTVPWNETHPPPLSHPFCKCKTYLQKRSAPSDAMRLKSHKDTHHEYLKGYYAILLAYVNYQKVSLLVELKH